MSNPDKFIQLSSDTPKLDQPPACPKCGSRQTSSAAKRPTVQSYWRCLKCGDVWNPAQLAGSGQRWWQR